MSRKYFSSRAGIAAYLGIARMTLSRWEKKLSLVPGTLRGHTFHLDESDVNKWYKELREKFRPYNAWEKDKSFKQM